MMKRIAIAAALLACGLSAQVWAQSRPPVAYFSAAGPFSGVVVTSGAIPTIASGACGATTNGTLAAGSRTNSGQVVIGAASTTVCTVTFAAALPAAPFCTIYPSNAAASATTVLAYVSSNTVNGFVITGSILANTDFNYICL